MPCTLGEYCIFRSIFLFLELKSNDKIIIIGVKYWHFYREIESFERITTQPDIKEPNRVGKIRPNVLL